MTAPILVASRYGRGVTHVGTYDDDAQWRGRCGYATACGSFITNTVYRGSVEKLTCTGCLEALGLPPNGCPEADYGE